MSEESVQKQKKILAVLKLAALGLIIVGVPVFVYIRYGDALFSGDAKTNIISYLDQHASYVVLILLALQILQVVVSVIPGQPIQFAASYVLSIPGALAVSVVGAMIGAAIAYFISRLLGYDAVRVLFDEEKISSYRDKLNSAKGIIIVFLIYLIPGLPKDLTAYAAGISDMRFIPFMIASTVGRTPAMMGSILFGHFLRVKNYTALIWVSVIVAVIVLVCFIKRKRIYAYIDELAAKGREKEAASDK